MVTKLTNKVTLFFLFFLVIPFYALAQKYTLDNETSFLQVLGTSTLHDWHIQVEKQSGTIVFSDVNKTEISSIVFSVESESLKSGKSGMDKKTYKALKTDQYKSIDYVFTKVVSLKEKEGGLFVVKADGSLTICGVTKPISLTFDIHIKENIIVVAGSHKLLMTDFGIKPPKALLGTIKTGNEIEVKYKTVFTN